MAVAIAVAVGLMVGAGTANAGPIAPGLPSWEQLIPGLRLPKSPQQQMSSNFALLQKRLAKNKRTAGQIGLALVAVGADEGQSYGPLKVGRAWSTLKVPVSLASQRRNGVAVAAKETKAIKLSDNDAAEDLWGSLGPSRAAVDAVTAVLREGHDSTTRVSSELDVPRSYPGYTPWALIDQARFGAHLPCLAGSDQIIRLMSTVAPNQQWGIAKVGRTQGAVTAVKGGWGPVSDTQRGHLVRQLGVITTNHGQVAVSMAAIPKSGSFSAGVAMLTEIGQFLARNMTLLPLGRCFAE